MADTEERILPSTPPPDLSEESESSEEEDIDEAEIANLEEKVCLSPYEYTHHVELITLLRNHGELEALRRAYERMTNLFPLTAELWLNWIRDETHVLSSPSDRSHVEDLFEKAVMDYVSPELWLEYGQFCIGATGTSEGLSKARSVFERALTAVGLHVSKGNVVWEVYREFENAILSGKRLQQGARVTAGDDGIADQTEKVSAIFRRQLTVPLIDMNETYVEYKNWLGETPPSAVTLAYEKASAKLKMCLPHEQKLMKRPTIEAYKAYLDYEKTSGNPSRIQCLYERAITDHCLQITLWGDYTKYLDSTLKSGSAVLPVYLRAVRNCPWSLELWQGYLVALERYNSPQSTITDVFEKALTAGLTSSQEYVQLWQTYIDYLRRCISWDEDHESELCKLRAVLERSVEHLSTYFSEDADPTCSIQQYWARLEAKYCGDMDVARTLWNEILALGHAHEASMWLEFYNLERSYGDSKHCRKILHRAAASVSDYPECIFETLTMFEREEGTLDTYENALRRIETQMFRVNDMRAKATKEEGGASTIHAEPKDAPKHKANTKKRIQENKKSDRNTKSLKRKQTDKPSASETVAFITASDNSSSEKVQAQEGALKTPVDVFKIPLPPPPLSPTSSRSPGGQELYLPPAKKTKVDDSEPSSQNPPGVRWGPPPKEKLGHNSSNDHLTIFVKNLAYDVTEPQIRAVFSECGEIADIRMVENYRKQFKGYCYVEYKHPESVGKAVKMDRQSLGGRPMYVDHSQDMSKTETKRKFQYPMAMEKNKLFVSGLPRSATDAQLQELFGKYGKIRNVRIVTYRSGVPKGLAFVEYEQELDAARAIVGADNTVMDQHTISVAISNPPTRKPKKDGEEVIAVETAKYPPKSLGAKGVTGPRGKGRTQLSLVPRALQRKPNKGPGLRTTKRPKETTKVRQTEPQTDGGSTKMSNADFSSMLMKK